MSETAKKKKGLLDYLFCLTVGGVYLYAILRAIIGSTFIRVEQWDLFLIGLIGITFFMLILFNVFTRLLVAGIVMLVAAYVFFTFESFSEQYPYLYEMFLMITGQIAYQRELGLMVVWLLGLLLGFAVVVFMLHFFNFYLLFVGGAAAFIFTWIPGFNRDETAFLFFLVAFCLILVRKTTRSVVVGLTAAPVCIAVVLLANVRIPQEHEMFVRRYVNPAGVDAFSDFVYELFNPTHFRFQTTGFSGAGGRLGGPVTPNNRSVMSVLAPGRTYLAGATSNTYTGDRWIQTLRDGDVYTHGLSPAHFEMLETAAALVRGATHMDVSAAVNLHVVWHDNELPVEDLRRLSSRMFSVIGVMQYETVTAFMPPEWLEESVGGYLPPFELLSPAASHFVTILERENWGLEQAMIQRSRYWHTYMPFEVMSVAQGQNRTGTVFLPPRAVELWFAEASYDYAPYVQILPTGNMQTPGFMSRGAGYHVRFLNVDTSFSFIDDILRGTNAGVYERRATERPQLPAMGNNMPTGVVRDRGVVAAWRDFRPEEEIYMVGGSVADIEVDVGGRAMSIQVEVGSSSDTTRSVATTSVTARFPVAHPVVDLPQTMDVAGFAEILGMYFDGADRFSPGIRYLPDAEQFMRLLDTFSAEILAEYSRQVREHFMQVPAVTPQRVYDITREIVYGLDNDFARVMAIRDFLLQFPYTLNPVPVPRGVCFVDFFLFEGQEGYCTYFASAMAVMARIAGVPSRYVEGFVIPPSPVPGEPVTVTNRMAHAWVEVYLEGFGWKIIEATPTYAFLMNPYVPLPPQGAISPTITDTGFFDRMYSMMSEWEIEQEQMQGFFGARPYTPAASPTQAYEPTPQHVAVSTLAAVVFAMLIITVLALRWRVKYNQWRVKNQAPGEQVKAYFRALMDIVTYHTMPLNPNETEKAYAEHMGKRFAFRSDTIFLRDIIALYYKAKYSPAKITQTEADIMQEAHGDMLRLLQSLRHKYVFLYLRYVRGLGSV